MANEIKRTNMHIQARGDTKQNWSTKNSVLLEREIGYEIDTRRFKIGDGTTAWNSLPYALDDNFRYVGELTSGSPLPSDAQQGDVYLLTGESQITLSDGKETKVYPDALIGKFGDTWRVFSEGFKGRTTLESYGITDAITKDEFNNAITGMFTYKGTCTVAELPDKESEPNLKTGWVYNIKIDGASDEDPEPTEQINDGEHIDLVKNGDNVVWVDEDGGYWDKLANLVDLNGFKWFQRIKVATLPLNGTAVSDTLITSCTTGLYYLEVTDNQHEYAWYKFSDAEGFNGILYCDGGPCASYKAADGTYKFLPYAPIYNDEETISLNTDLSTYTIKPDDGRIGIASIGANYQGTTDENEQVYFFDGKDENHWVALSPYGVISKNNDRVIHPPIIEVSFDNEDRTATGALTEIYNFMNNYLIENQIYKLSFNYPEYEKNKSVAYVMHMAQPSNNLNDYYVFIDIDIAKEMGLTQEVNGDMVFICLCDYDIEGSPFDTSSKKSWQLVNSPKNDSSFGLRDALHAMYPGRVIWGSSKDADVVDKTGDLVIDDTMKNGVLLYYTMSSDGVQITQDTGDNIDILGYIQPARDLVLNVPEQSSGQQYTDAELTRPMVMVAETITANKVILENVNLLEFSSFQCKQLIKYVNCESSTGLALDFTGCSPEVQIIVDNCTYRNGVIKLPEYTKYVPRITNCEGLLIQTADGKQWLTYEAHGSDKKGTIIAVDLNGDINFLPYNLE